MLFRRQYYKNLGNSLSSDEIRIAVSRVRRRAILAMFLTYSFEIKKCYRRTMTICSFKNIRHNFIQKYIVNIWLF